MKERGRLLSLAIKYRMKLLYILLNFISKDKIKEEK